MLRVADHFEKTDTGRQRRANEDSLFARSPVFVVADGMGGAQAGEVASRIAVEAFEPGLPAGGSGEERLAAVARLANQRIHDLATDDAARTGMGTTLTAALVDAGGVSLAHVGDSRAYRLRDGGLERLTNDHSLVGELVRRGKLTEAEAEEHPQKSVITRALGVEAGVEVDTITVPARAGDVFLLCSDGLTSMIGDDLVGEILHTSKTLSEAGHRLVDEANAHGGRDNITVVIFRLEDLPEGETALPPPVEPPADQVTMLGAAAPNTADVNAALRSRERDASAAAQATPAAAQASARHQPRRPRRRGGAPEASRPRRRIRGLRPLLGVLAVVVVIGVAGWMVSRAVFFVGADQAGFVTVYRGLPYEGPFGAKLYESYYISGVPAADLPVARRSKLLDHQLRGHSDASDLVRKIELDQLDAR